jgi:hypothetical protein
LHRQGITKHVERLLRLLFTRLRFSWEETSKEPFFEHLGSVEEIHEMPTPKETQVPVLVGKPRLRTVHKTMDQNPELEALHGTAQDEGTAWKSLRT